MKRINKLHLLTSGVIVGALGLILGGCATPPPAQLTAEQRRSIESAIQTAGLQPAQSLEINDESYLVATFEIDVENDAALARQLAVGISSPEQFASKAVLVIRNAALPLNFVKRYRVTLNGPSPGPGLITRYGSARFLEGGRVSWEPSKRN